jgi:O-antigen ligase
VDDSRIWAHVHNDVLGLAVSYGIPAALIWIALAIVFYTAMVRRLRQFGRSPGSWLLAGFLGSGAGLHMFYTFGLVHENPPIFVKACTMLLLWGLFVAADREIARSGPAPE